jgi:hypothetical protein
MRVSLPVATATKTLSAKICKTSRVVDILALQASGAQFYVQHGEQFGDQISWSGARAVKLAKECNGLTYQGFGGHPYTHYLGRGMWARNLGSEHVVRLTLRAAPKKPVKAVKAVRAIGGGKPISASYYSVGDIVQVYHAYSAHSFYQVTGTNTATSVILLRRLKTHRQDNLNDYFGSGETWAILDDFDNTTPTEVRARVSKAGTINIDGGKGKKYQLDSRLPWWGRFD